jgi:hypothetical protein
LNRTTANVDDTDAGLRQTILALRRLLAQLETASGNLAPWEAARPLRPIFDGRMSATDQLSWWFRPAGGGDDPWDSFFSDEADEHGQADHPDDVTGFPDVGGVPIGRPLLPDPAPRGSPARLQSLLAEPEEDLPDAAAESVVTCLYDFVHALGREDLDGAMACVAADYHCIEDDREVDRDGLARRVKTLLDSLHGWEKEVFLVEIPQPLPHPAMILVQVELQINARHRVTQERRTIVDRRVAVFERQRDRSWRIAALSPV